MNRHLVSALGLLMIAASPLPAQEIAPTERSALEAYCADKACRHHADLQVRLADGNTLTEELELHRPTIANGEISILLGETLTAAAEFDGETFVRWRESRRRERGSTPILTARLSQANDGSIVAEIANAGDEPIKLRMFTRMAGSTDDTYIASCAIQPAARIYEYWNEAVTELIIREASRVSDDTALLCD